MCQFFLFRQTSINIIKNMEIFLSSETTETIYWFTNVTMLHLPMTYTLLLNVILITDTAHTSWPRTLKQDLLHMFLWNEQHSCATLCVSLRIIFSQKSWTACPCNAGSWIPVLYPGAAVRTSHTETSVKRTHSTKIASGALGSSCLKI